ncbi:MAG: prolyl oligopeptidase family serine peptidase, partial [Desulfobacterales bacterium]|nr:prolyl oligopeptidase family serine peptidase [Desulfobacterales bacterium]
SLYNLKEILMFHGEHDEVVPCENALEIYNKAKKPKEIIIFEKGDHVISNIEQQRRFIDETINWFKTFPLID